MAKDAIEQFGQAVSEYQDSQEDRVPLVVVGICGKPVTFYEPNGGQIMAMSMLGVGYDAESRIGLMRDAGLMLCGMTDDEGGAHIQAMLMHRRQPLTAEDLVGIVRKLTEAYTSRPTEPLSESSQPERDSGTYSPANSRRAPSDHKSKRRSSE